MDSAVDAIVTADERGVIRSFNRAAERLFGYRAKEAIGQPISLPMPEPDRSCHQQYIERYLATGDAHIMGIGREVEAQRKDGSGADLSGGERVPNRWRAAFRRRSARHLSRPRSTRTARTAGPSRGHERTGGNNGHAGPRAQPAPCRHRHLRPSRLRSSDRRVAQANPVVLQAETTASTISPNAPASAVSALLRHPRLCSPSIRSAYSAKPPAVSGAARPSPRPLYGQRSAAVESFPIPK